jgi:hypothetical protein
VLAADLDLGDRFIFDHLTGGNRFVSLAVEMGLKIYG